MIANAFFLALREIRSNLLRAGLTMLGIIIGISAVIFLVTLGASASKQFTNDVSTLGNNTVVVFPGNRGPAQVVQQFTLATADAIRREIPGLEAVEPEASTSAAAVNGNNNQNADILGATMAAFAARNLSIALGRPFTDGELRSARNVCMIGETVRKKLFGGANPVGSRIRIGKLPCEVIAVLTPKGASLFGDQDNRVYMPLLTVQRKLIGNNHIGFILIAVKDTRDIEKVRGQLQRLLREKRHLAAGVDDDFTVQDQQELLRFLTAGTALLTAFIAAVAAVSLLVAGIGIMNVMLMSVTERTREIGIRLAIGARERDVLLQFLIEAVVMSALGGIIGVILGLSAATGLVALLQFPFVFSPGIVVLAVVFSALVGVGFGYFPARRAARLDPIEALRHE